MADKDLIAVALAGIALWMIAKSSRAAVPVPTTGARVVARSALRPGATRYYTYLPWVDPNGYGGLGGSNADYLAVDANGVSVIP